MAKLPDDPQDLIGALHVMCERRKKLEILPILEVGRGSTEEVDFFNNVSCYRLDISIPFGLFIDLDTGRNRIEETLCGYARELFNGNDGEVVTQVNLTPDWSTVGNSQTGAAPLKAGSEDVARIWKERHFRLFLSHSSTDKVFASQLKVALAKARIDTFVAHKDIRPNKAWQEEIKFGLASCNALLFVASKASNKSYWCQQEVGWAIGRGILVTSYSLSSNPLGFAGAHQDWKADGHKISGISTKLVEMLIKDERSSRAIHEPLAILLQSSKHEDEANYWLQHLEMTNSLNPEILVLIDNAKLQTSISKKPALLKRIDDLLSKNGYQPTASKVQVSEDEYDPFADE